MMTKDELALLIQRRTTRLKLSGTVIDKNIVERHYQQRAIRAIGDAFEKKQREALVVMATGAGKTNIFAKDNDHANFIQRRFDHAYPEYTGHIARVVTFKTEYAQALIDDFSVRDKAPHIDISVDMLDTGIDIAEVVNLVFCKLVRANSKFWQMIGRGTRLCPDLFGSWFAKAWGECAQ